VSRPHRDPALAWIFGTDIVLLAASIAMIIAIALTH
jgi:hypothetical protein